MDIVTGGQRKWQYGELHDLFFLQNSYWGDQIKEGEMGTACGTYWREKKCI